MSAQDLKFQILFGIREQRTNSKSYCTLQCDEINQGVCEGSRLSLTCHSNNCLLKLKPQRKTPSFQSIGNQHRQHGAQNDTDQ